MEVVSIGTFLPEFLHKQRAFLHQHPGLSTTQHHIIIAPQLNSKMPSEGRSNTRLPQSNANYYPIFESVIPLGVHMAIRTQWYRQMTRRIRARRVLGINPRTDFLTVEEETVEPLPPYTKVPSAGEITVEISTAEKLPVYHDAVPTDDVVAGRKRKRRTRFDGRCRWSAKRRRTEIVVEVRCKA